MLRRHLALACGLLLLPAGAALAKGAYPQPPQGWLHSATAVCVIARESGGDVHNKRNVYSRGKWQFEYGTWRSVGGSGDPANATEREQDYRAYLLYRRSGWATWTNYDHC